LSEISVTRVESRLEAVSFLVSQANGSPRVKREENGMDYQVMMSVLTDKQKQQVRQAVLGKVLNAVGEAKVTFKPVDVSKVFDINDVLYDSDVWEKVSQHLSKQVLEVFKGTKLTVKGDK